MRGPRHLSASPSAHAQPPTHTHRCHGILKKIYFVYFHGENESCDLLVHLKPIKDLLALIKWHHFKG